MLRGITIALCLLAIYIIAPIDTYAQEVTLLLDPSTQNVANESVFSIEIRTNTGGQNINTVAANLTYDTSVLTPQSVDTTGSFVSIWFENDINESSGEIRLTGSVPSPGVNGDNLLFAKINFTAGQAQTTQIQFNTDSAMFRDSDNTNILSQTVGAVVTIDETGVTPTVSNNPTPTGGSTIQPTTFISPTPMPSLTPARITQTTSPSPAPTSLPDTGITTPTYMLIGLAIGLAVIAFVLLV